MFVASRSKHLEKNKNKIKEWECSPGCLYAVCCRANVILKAAQKQKPGWVCTQLADNAVWISEGYSFLFSN